MVPVVPDYLWWYLWYPWYLTTGGGTCGTCGFSLYLRILLTGLLIIIINALDCHHVCSSCVDVITMSELCLTVVCAGFGGDVHLMPLR